MRRRGDDDPDPIESGSSKWPMWAPVLARVRVALDSGRADRGRSVQQPLNAAAARSARAHGRLLRALGRQTTGDEDAVGGLVDEAAELLLAVSEVWRLQNGADQRAGLAEALEGRLRGHEADVLAGELTYEITTRDAHVPAARVRKALVPLRASDGGGHGDLLSLRIAAVDLAALMVRAAGNLASGGCASGAAAEGAAISGVPLRAVVLEIAARAEQGRRTGDRVDLVDQQLCAALRVSVSVPPLPASAASGRGPTPSPELLERARGAWLSLAAHEHAAVAALDAEMPESAYSPRFATLSDAVIEGAANVLHGGRLIQRAEAFRHRKAWHGHAVTLSYAVEAYVCALRGDGEGLARAQLIVLTRLVRAAAAIAVLDAVANAPAAQNGVPR